jgi:apolipoprotein D and lipocalin family protein
MRILTLCLILMSCRSVGKMNNTVDNSTVKEVDIERYAGTWYEIARFPHSFEKDLVGVTATYTLKNDGKIKVVNQGYVKTLDGRLKKTEGKAKIPDPKEPGKLKVSFFLFFFSDYFIMELDKDYQYALVGSSSDKYLWILSRTPRMSEDNLTMLIDKAKKRGYEIEKLEMVLQK